MPPVVLTSLNFFNKPVKIGGKIAAPKAINIARFFTLRYDNRSFASSSRRLTYRPTEKPVRL